MKNMLCGKNGNANETGQRRMDGRTVTTIKSNLHEQAEKETYSCNV